MCVYIYTYNYIYNYIYTHMYRFQLMSFYWYIKGLFSSGLEAKLHIDNTCFTGQQESPNCLPF